jgi:hypothetical protein
VGQRHESQDEALRLGRPVLLSDLVDPSEYKDLEVNP